MVFQFKYFQILLPNQQSQTACGLFDTLSNLITVMFTKLHASWTVEPHSNQNGFQFLELHSTKTDHNFLNWISFQRRDINEWHIVVLNWHSAHIFNFCKFSETWDDLYNKELLGGNFFLKNSFCFSIILCSHELAWSASLGWYGRVCKTLFEHSWFLQKNSKEGESVCISAWRIYEAKVISMRSLQVLPSFTGLKPVKYPLHRYTLPCTLFFPPISSV